MQLLYHSDNFVVTQFDVPPADDAEPDTAGRGGFEIVDVRLRQGIYLRGALAERFEREMRALAREQPDAEVLDDCIGSFAALAPTPLTAH